MNRTKLDRQTVIFATESFFSTWALSRVFRLNPGNLLSVLIFVACFLFFRYVDGLYRCGGSSAGEPDENTPGESAQPADSAQPIDPTKKRAKVCSAVFGAIFTLFYFLYDRDNYVAELSNRAFRFLMLVAVIAGLFFFFMYVLRFLYVYLADRSRTDAVFYSREGTSVGDDEVEKAEPGEGDTAKAEPGAGASKTKLWRKLFSYYEEHMTGCTFVLCLIFFLPYFLYQFPGIMTPDSIVQYEQALHIKPYSNHHPWVHTLILELFYDIGYAFTRNPNISASFYTVAQMVFMAWSASFVVKTLRIKGIRPLFCLLATLFYALVPYNDVFAVTIWKDIPFAGVVAVFVCVLLRLDDMLKAGRTADDDASEETGDEKITETKKDTDIGSLIKLLVMFVIFGLGICLLRSNGWYAFIVLVPFLIVHFFKRSKVAVALTVSIVVLALIVKYPVMDVFNVEQPDFVESLSIPLQQVASVIVSGGEVDEASMGEIRKVVDLTYISQLYEPTFADNIKELVRAGDQDYLKDNKLTFLKIYLKLGLKNPAEYLKAFVLQTYGYFYPDRDYDVADAEGVVSSSLEFSTVPLIGGPAVIKSKEVFNKLGNMIPIYSVLWCMGAMFWILLTGISVLIVKGRWENVIYYLPYLLLVLTVLVATPVSTEFRYVYFLMFSIPLIFTVFAMKDKEEEPGRR